MKNEGVLMFGLMGLVASAVVFNAHPQPAAPRIADQTANTESDFQGVIGVCVRWKADARHVDDAVVVVPSSSSALNKATPAAVKGMSWTRPENYDGGWFGVNISIGGGATPRARPDCSALKTDLT
jgi:hypothetical protein